MLIFGLTLLVASLAFLVLSPQTGAYLQRTMGLSNVLLNFWTILGWLLTILAITLALDVLYYIAPNAEIPFRWVTPGGFMAMVLLLIASQIMRLSIAILHYDQLYGQLGAGIVLLIWLYVLGLVVLTGIQINVVSARLAEEHQGAVIVGPLKEDP